MNKKEYVIYTIKFSKSGINQYANIKEHIDTKEIIVLDYYVQYQNISSQPDLKNCKSLNDVITVLSEYSYTKKAEVWLIDGDIPGILEEEIEYIRESAEKIIEMKIKFLNEVIMPLVPKGYKLKYNDFEFKNKSLKQTNYELYRKINYLTYKFLKETNLTEDKYSFTPEENYEKSFLNKLYFQE